MEAENLLVASFRYHNGSYRVVFDSRPMEMLVTVRYVFFGCIL
jgi:hypothetical protein